MLCVMETNDGDCEAETLFVNIELSCQISRRLHNVRVKSILIIYVFEKLNIRSSSRY